MLPFIQLLSTNMCLAVLLKTSNRRGTQIHSKWLLSSVLFSHLDLIGDQSDAKALPLFADIESGWLARQVKLQICSSGLLAISAIYSFEVRFFF